MHERQEFVFGAESALDGRDLESDGENNCHVTQENDEKDHIQFENVTFRSRDAKFDRTM
jgi:hypothetical protein